jgi:hypothetical protein
MSGAQSERKKQKETEKVAFEIPGKTSGAVPNYSHIDLALSSLDLRFGLKVTRVVTLVQLARNVAEGTIHHASALHR